MSAPQGERSTGVKVLMGCSIGCAVIVLLIVGCGVAVYFWATGRRDVVEPSKLLPKACDGFAIVRVRPEDTGLQQCFAQILIAHQRAMGQPVRPELQQIKQGGADVEKMLRKFLPANLLVVASYDEESKTVRYSGVFNFAGFWRLLRFVVNKAIEGGQQGGGQVAVREYAGVKMGQLGNPGAEQIWVGMYLNNLIFAQTAGHGSVLIDQLKAPSDPSLPESLARVYGQVDQAQDVVFAFINDHGAVTDLLTRLLGDEEEGPGDPAQAKPMPFDPAVISGAAGHVDLVSSDELHLRAVLETKSPADAARLAGDLARVKAEWMAKNPDIQKLEVTPSEQDIVVEMVLTGLESKIDQFMQTNLPRPQGVPMAPAPLPAPQPEPVPAPQ